MSVGFICNVSFIWTLCFPCFVVCTVIDCLVCDIAFVGMLLLTFFSSL